MESQNKYHLPGSEAFMLTVLLWKKEDCYISLCKIKKPVIRNLLAAFFDFLSNCRILKHLGSALKQSTVFCSLFWISVIVYRFLAGLACILLGLLVSLFSNILFGAPHFVAFCWLAWLQKVLTIDVLQRHNHTIVNGCLLCLWDTEDFHHLFIHCIFSTLVWNAIFRRFGITWVMPWIVRTIKDLFDQWKFGYCSYKGKILWMMTLMAVFWTIWIERHCHTFQGIQNHDN